ncbi:MAG: sulfotransferase family 2 domain-containing protein [Bacteroidales bacterium]
MIVFVHIEKTAGTTLKFILRNSFGWKHCDTGRAKTKLFTQADLAFAKRISGNIKAISGHNLIEPTKHLTDADLHFMTFLRDPVSRSASYYQDYCLRGNNDITFQDWMMDESRHNVQVKRIAGTVDLGKAKALLKQNYFFVGLTEQFDLSLKLLQLLSPASLNLKYKRKVVAQNNIIKNQLLQDPTSLAVLKETNELDIQLYHFVEQELFPSMIQQYQGEIDAVRLPEDHYNHHRTINYQSSIFWNKFIYRTLVKLKSK